MYYTYIYAKVQGFWDDYIMTHSREWCNRSRSECSTSSVAFCVPGDCGFWKCDRKWNIAKPLTIERAIAFFRRISVETSTAQKKLYFLHRPNRYCCNSLGLPRSTGAEFSFLFLSPATCFYWTSPYE